MNARIIIFITLVSVGLLTNCASTDTSNSDAVKQSEIYQSYSVTYDAGDKELSATATFRFGGSTGTTLLLSKPSVVSFNGEEMISENSAFTGTYYRVARQTGYVNTCTFVFVDTEKKEYINTAPLMAAEILELQDRLERSGTHEISWDDPLKPGETITLFIEDSKGNSATVSVNAQGATSVSFGSDNVKDLIAGPCQMWLTRISEYTLKQATRLQGTISIKYISEKRRFNLSGDLAYSKKLRKQ